MIFIYVKKASQRRLGLSPTLCKGDVKRLQKASQASQVQLCTSDAVSDKHVYQQLIRLWNDKAIF